MPMIDLTDLESGQLMAVLANAEGKGITWATVNPLMIKIGTQLRMQAQQAMGGDLGLGGRRDNSKEISP